MPIKSPEEMPMPVKSPEEMPMPVKSPEEMPTPIMSPEEMPRSQRAEGATPIKFPKRPRSAANSRPDRPRVKKKPQVRGCRYPTPKLNGPAGQPETWGRSRDPNQTPPDSKGVPRDVLHVFRQKEVRKIPSPVSRKNRRGLLHKYVVEKKSRAAIIPSCSKSGILHSYYILWSREGRAFCTCIIPCSIKLAHSHSWSFKLEEQKFATKKFGLNSRPDRPERCGKASRDGGCRTLVPSGTGRQDSPGPGDDPGMDHFDPTRLKWGPQGRFDVFGPEKKQKYLFRTPAGKGKKTWDTDPPTPAPQLPSTTPSQPGYLSRRKRGRKGRGVISLTFITKVHH